MGIRVLIVDSQPLIRSGVAGLLRQTPGIDTVLQASSARQAVEVARAQHPDVVVIEPQMPDGDGPGTIRAIREDCPQTNILVLTQQEDPAEAMRALEAGAVGYVLKDIEPEHLLSAVRRVASGQAMLNPKIARHMVGRLAAPNSQSPDDTLRHQGLTAREIQILSLLAGGLSDREVARRLYLSEATVKTHLKAIYRKLRVRNRAQAAAVAAISGLVPRPSS